MGRSKFIWGLVGLLLCLASSSFSNSNEKSCIVNTAPLKMESQGNSLNPQSFPNAITFNVLSALGGIPDFTYERTLSGDRALAGRAQFGNVNVDDWSISFINLYSAYRFFVFSPANAANAQGFWCGPGLALSSLRASYAGQSASNFGYGVFGEIGYKFLFPGEVTYVLSPVIQIGISHGSDIQINDRTLKGSGAAFGIGLNVGVAF